MKKALFLVASFWLASPAAAQNGPSYLKITGSINGVTDGSNYSCPAPTGPGQIFFNGVDIYTYNHPNITPTPAPAPANMKIIGNVSGWTDAAHYACPAPLTPGMIFFNGIDVYMYIHPTTAPTPVPAPAAPQPAAAPAAAPIAVSTTPVKTAGPAAASVPDQSAAKAQTAAAQARKKEFERLSRKLDALADKIEASKLDAANKSKLSARVKALAARLKDPAGKLTPAAAEDAFTKLNDDFAAASSKP